MLQLRQAVAVLAFAAASPVLAAPVADSLAPHRAVYDLMLTQADERAGIAGMNGRMVYEFKGSACTGFTTNFRFVTQVDTGEDKRLSDQQTTTFEDLAARKFRFSTKSFSGQQLEKEVTGNAQEADAGIKVSLAAPEKRELSLAEGRFPTEHMLDVLENARSGKHLFESRIFDGSDNADQTLMATTIIGNRTQPAADDADAAKAGTLAKAEYWPVTIAYFSESQAADAKPTYRMAFKLYDNGVIRDLTMDYGDYVLSGKLNKLEILKSEPCKPAN
jgi:hypothetical protein